MTVQERAVNAPTFAEAAAAAVAILTVTAIRPDLCTVTTIRRGGGRYRDQTTPDVRHIAGIPADVADALACSYTGNGQPAWPYLLSATSAVVYIQAASHA